jgi:AP-3 complex subunit beta
MISKGRNVSEYFAQVVKNVASPSLEVRKLVYIYLLRYAEAEPDLVLLSINTFQRDLADSSPLIRAMALRVLSGIHVPTIANLVVLAIKKCAADTSPYVRKAAALSIPKCYRYVSFCFCGGIWNFLEGRLTRVRNSLDESQLPSLIEILSTLLRDRSPLSIGSVATAFETVCPTRLDLLHAHYRRLCRVLVDVDEWGQVNLLELLVRYARTMLPRPTASHDVGKEKEDVDPDLDLLLVSAEPLFQSRNPAVRDCDSQLLRKTNHLNDFSGRDVGNARVLLPSPAVTASQNSSPTTPTYRSVARSGTGRPDLHSLHFSHRPGTSTCSFKLI